MKQTEFIYGGDYNPEQWLDTPEILEKDIEYMKEAHINSVTLGVFAWSVLEPEEGIYQFDWLHKIIDRLYENGIMVVLSTPSAARPKWLSDKYPEVLRVNADRTHNLFGGRHNNCYTSPVYREKVAEINKRLSERFGKHPAVKLWHISNELGGECHCPLCQNAFRRWLKKRYGTIEKLNKAWNTMFWSHTYQNFDQVESPSPLGETTLHGLNLDWKRFVTDQTADFVACEKEAIRKGGSILPVTINMTYDNHELNYHKFKDLIDVASWDNYPLWHKNSDIEIATDTAFQHDFIRSLLKKPFLLMESCPSSTNWQGVSKLKRPGMLSAASLQAIAHGADSVQYFQIRQSRGASEKFHGAVIDHYGSNDTRVFKEVKEIGRHLKKLKEIAGSTTKAKVAIIHDCESRWAMEDAQGPRNNGLYYMETVRKIYNSFRKLGLNIDVLDMEENLDRYDIVLAPMLYMFRCGIEDKIRNFVKEGGTFLMTYWSGIVNETDLCYLGAVPHQLQEVFGLRSTEIDSLYDGEKNYGISTGNFFEKNRQYQCANFCDLIQIDTAETLLTYREDFYAGYPAAVYNCFGQGKSYYICADFEQVFYDDLAKKIIHERGLEAEVFSLPSGIEVTTRQSQDKFYVFVQNFSNESVQFDFLDTEYQIVSGNQNGRLERYETCIFEKKI